MTWLARSLQTRILAVVLLCVSIPGLLMGIYLLERNSEVLTAKTRESLANHLFRRANLVDDWMSQRLHEVQRWSTSFVVIEGLEQALSGGDTSQAAHDLRDYLDAVLAHYESYESLFVIGPRGRVLASTRAESWEEHPWSPLGHRSAALTTSLISPIHVSEKLGRPTLLVMHAVQDRRDRTLGYLVERPDLVALAGLLATNETGSPTFWLLDQEGAILAEAGEIAGRPAERTFAGALPPEDAEVGPLGEVGLEGHGSVLFAVRRLQGPFRGYVAATLPEREAFRTLAEARYQLLAIGLPALGLVVLASFLAARRLLKPILLLSDGARRLSAGELDVSLPVRGHDEIAELTGAFNEMTQRLRENRQRLEEAHVELERRNEELRSANRALEGLAITDGLTGLYNRRHFEDTLQREIRRHTREQRPFTLVLLDLDHFKQYNDRWGHTQGDVELRRVSDHVKQSVRSSDMAFRYGGEELAVLLSACPQDQAGEVAEKIRLAVKQEDDDDLAHTTVSVGVASFPEHGESPRSLVDAADAALYAAKAAGRDQVVMAETAAPRG